MENPVSINSRDLASMVGHWLETPPDGYLGQSYGSDVKALIQSPMASGLADGLIAKCRADVPLANNAAVDVYSYDAGMDQKVIAFEVAGELVTVGGN